jgi:peptide/nickel transport system permease protein
MAGPTTTSSPRAPAPARRSARPELRVPPIILVMMIVLGSMILAALVLPIVVSSDPTHQELRNRLLPPAFLGGRAQYPLGADQLGRDTMIRLVYATRTTLLISLSGMVVAIAVGLVLGVTSGLYGGWPDRIVTFVIDANLSIPFTLIAILASSVFGSGVWILVLIVGFTGWSGFARLVRGQIMSIRKMSFIEGSRALGASDLRIVVEHILPNIASSMIVYGTMRISSFILLESSVSFLGLGIQPPDISLGLMVSNGRNYLVGQWWLSIFPSIVITLVVFQISLIGDWLRDVLDPRIKA